MRFATADDLPAVAAIQQSAPETAHWRVEDYLAHEFAVAVCDEAVIGFIVLRRVAEDEAEILNLAVDSRYRRQGAASRLLQYAIETFHGSMFLEVRESNAAARAFYETFGFEALAVREGYYDNPPERAVIMRRADARPSTTIPHHTRKFPR